MFEEGTAELCKHYQLQTWLMKSKRGEKENLRDGPMCVPSGCIPKLSIREKVRGEENSGVRFRTGWYATY